MAFEDDAGLASAATDNEALKIVGDGERDKRSSKPSPNKTQAVIPSELGRSNVARRLGPTASGAVPVSSLCRCQIAGAVDPATSLEAWCTDKPLHQSSRRRGNTRVREGHNG
jgi:hypothetical protein